MALCAYLSLPLRTCSRCVHCKTKTNKKFRGFYEKKIVIFKIFKTRILMEANFENSIIQNLPRARSVEPFRRFLDTNKQRHQSKVYI